MNRPAESLSDLEYIEHIAESYRGARDALREEATDANAAIDAVKAHCMPRLRAALVKVAALESQLRDAIATSSPALWQRPRTRVIHGVKVGWQKLRGKVEIADEAKVIARIRDLLPADQAELLIRRRETVHKPAVYDLTAGDLRRLGITVTDDIDQVIVRDVASELDRALEALLADAAREMEEARS